ncbi:MAG: tRNA preQ1(34) S-adenosylmethionine ribosyltransferase-isomerase QueA [Myxococcota bacterium]|jgi:S-adenosylmethionine:tRNA ribosyltransferase-isomerase|nr:tRNA preQ1(34) S-adenosylmethionine ribosyltransferase-isomerase QueA [Myxococcota bacterium]
MSVDLNHISAYRYEHPAELIASVPVEPRDQSRLLVVGESRLEHHNFEAILEELRAGDLLIANHVAVRPCRLFARKHSGGQVEVLILDGRAEGDELECMLRSRRPLHPGDRMQLLQLDGSPRPDGFVQLLRRHPNGWLLRFEHQGSRAALLEACGQLPLPPYILKRRKDAGAALYEAEDKQRYQTVFAREPGAVAAPTAGLHFTPELLGRLEAAGVGLASLRLDVGAGTFLPMRSELLDEHHMHEERYAISEDLVQRFAQTRDQGGRIVAVGTTVMRALEDQFLRFGELRAGDYATALFIRQGFRFQAVDRLLTNFHLPESTLLVLVAAFGGYERVMAAYAEAVAQRYRLFSYGDAMLLSRA